MSDRQIVCDDLLDREFLQNLRDKAVDTAGITIEPLRSTLLTIATASDTMDAILYRLKSETPKEPPCSES